MKEKSIPAELNKDKMHEHLITENVEYQIGKTKPDNSNQDTVEISNDQGT